MMHSRLRHCAPLLLLLAFCAATRAATLINEILVNPDGPDGNWEFIELRNTEGPANADGLWILQLDGNGGTNTVGTVDEAWSLSNVWFGINGLLMVGNNYDDAPGGGPWSNVVARRTGFGEPATLGDGDLNNSSYTWLLVRGFSGNRDDDLDTNNDGTLDVTPWAELMDGVGWTDGDAGDHVYAPAALTQSDGIPDGATRFPGNLTPLAKAAWFNGDIVTNLTDTYGVTYHAADHSANMPAGARLTPGAPNYDLHQPPVIDTDPPTEDAWGLVGAPLTVTVRALEVNGDTVALSATGLPPGAAFAPAAGKAPLASTLNWTPAAGQQGTYAVTLRAADADGHEALNIVLHVVDADRYLLNEILCNPNGSDDAKEFLELRHTLGPADADGLWVLQLDGNGGTSTVGQVDEAWDLSGLEFGNNGLLLLGNNYDATPPGGPWSNIVARASDFGDPTRFAAGDLGNNSLTWLLVRGFTGAPGNDLDTNNDGVLDVTPWTQLLDSVGWTDGGNNDFVYSAAALTQADGSPDAASRAVANTTPSAKAAWFNGDLIDTVDNLGRTYDPARASTGLPSGARITPGRTNFPADTDADGDGLPDSWEFAHFRSDQAAAALDDPDGDAFINRDEYIADTDPRNALSYLHDIDTLPDGTNWTVVFGNSSTGRLYAIQWRASLTQGAWGNLGAGVRGNGGELRLTATNAASAAFYRKAVRLP